jgi:ASCH domain-containing protein
VAAPPGRRPGNDRRELALARRVLAGERRALSVRRPWANLIIAGYKTVESRSWVTGHRGELAIHGGQAWEPAGAMLAAELGLRGFDTPRECAGGYLGLVRLVDVHPAAGCCAPWGDQEAGVFHWVLGDPAPFSTPVPGKGRLGLYWVPADLLWAERL